VGRLLALLLKSWGRLLTLLSGLQLLLALCRGKAARAAAHAAGFVPWEGCWLCAVGRLLALLLTLLQS
jgi:hypothetical protein